MTKEIIQSDAAPKAIGPYSQGAKFGGFIFLSGQIALNKETLEIIDGDITAQTEMVLSNIEALLHETGSDMPHIVKSTIFITDMGEFSKVNEVYGRFFEKEPPARSCIEVSALPKGALVEIEVIAAEK